MTDNRNTPTTPELEKAYTQYIARQHRSAHPNGKFDKAGRWYPSDAETCSCCGNQRSPSREWPYSYLNHCRTAEHVAHLNNVDPKALRRLINQRKDQ